MKLEPAPCGNCKSYSFRVRNYLRDKEIFGSGEVLEESHSTK